MRDFLSEVVASLRSQPVVSVLTTLVISSLMFTVLMTAGRAFAAEQEVLASIDDVGTRTIQVFAPDAAGVRSEVLDRIAHIAEVEWAAAFSAAIDAHNARIADGTRVPARYIYSDQLAELGIHGNPQTGATAYLSKEAFQLLGFIDWGGEIILTNGASATIGGRIDTPDFLHGFEPVIFIPAPSDSSARINVLLVVADTPDSVAPVTSAVLSVLAADDATNITVETSESLAQLRGVIQTQLAGSFRSLILALLTVMTVLVAVILFGFVVIRRKDFGRRRALGATQGFIIALILAQTSLLAVIGLALGVAAAVVLALVTQNPVPNLVFVAAVGILALAAALLAALAPALVASRREPIRELRVP